jgi:PhzF family phenazine biosynthesis protein
MSTLPLATSRSPTQRGFVQLDVFTARALLGNPLAVVTDAQGLSDDDMQRFARWTNLSETTFLLPPDAAAHGAGADYAVRIFTPDGELPFAGHPTLGSCHAWLLAGGVARQAGLVRQHCTKGLIDIRQDKHTGQLAFRAPDMHRSTPGTALLASIVQALGLDPSALEDAALLDNGPIWLALQLRSAQAVHALQPDHAQLKALGLKVGVVHVDGTQVTVRAFAAAIGVPEDPVTGSLNASLAQWLMAEGRVPDHYVASQGTALLRDGRVHIHRDARGAVWVGGDVVTCIQGSVML